MVIDGDLHKYWSIAPEILFGTATLGENQKYDGYVQNCDTPHVSTVSKHWIRPKRGNQA